MHAVEPNHDRLEISDTHTLLTKRLHELRQEFAPGEEQLTELDRKRAQVRDTLLRINGAIQVLEELLHEGDAITHALPQTLSTLLSPWFSGADPSLWLIRRLEVSLDVNAAWERESLARAWVARIGRWLDATLRAGADGENVVWFPDRAAYLARFLVDVAQGQAWSKWYYESFEGLRPLPTSATLRTAICDQPAIGRAALLQLPESELQQVLRALTASDARRILDHIARRRASGR